jgi:tRNA pseudouridine55 synthase
MSVVARRNGPTVAIDGVLVVDKPAGPTSHDVVAAVRRITGERRIGHAGTLDPMASGVLVLVLGRATRLARFLAASQKTYEAEVGLGVETDTWDAWGTVVGQPSVDGGGPEGPWPTPERLEGALARFRGSFAQVPPPFSAKRVAGKRAYALARRAEPVALRPSPVTVFALSGRVIGPGRLGLAVTCSPGFYVRSLARDLGHALGCGGHLTALRRTRSGEFDLAKAVRLEDLTEPGAVSGRLEPLESLLGEWPAARLTAQGADRARHGAEVGPEGLEQGGGGLPAALGREAPDGEPAKGSVAPPVHVRLFAPDGRLLALAQPARPGGPWPLRPVIVLR